MGRERGTEARRPEGSHESFYDVVQRSDGRDNNSGDAWACLQFYLGCESGPCRCYWCKPRPFNVEMDAAGAPSTVSENAARHSRLWNSLWCAALARGTVRAGVDVEEALRRLVALTVAAANVDVVHLLLQKAADPDMKGESGYTAREWATWYSSKNGYSDISPLLENPQEDFSRPLSSCVSYFGLVFTRACPTWAHAEQEEWCGRCMGEENTVLAYFSMWEKKHACEYIPEAARENLWWYLLVRMLRPTLLSFTLARDKAVSYLA